MQTPHDTPPGTRAAGLARLVAFLPRAGRRYADGRNADHGPERRENVSGLAPYVRHRLVTEREVVAAVLARHGPVAAEKFIQEVVWRTYWKGWLEHRPAAWTRYLAGRDTARAAMATSGGLRRAVGDAEDGTTGIEGFDDWARELAETGYLHNHARMWFASIWIFTLELPWELGADLFTRHLLCADPASNTLSWRWVAGLQTAGKTYLATADNIARCTDGRFRPEGLARRAEPLGEPPLPGPRALPAAGRFEGGPALLLAHGDDLNPESLIGDGVRLAGAVIAGGTAFGERGAAFLAEGLADLEARLAGRIDGPVAVAPMVEAEAVIQAARATKVTAVLTPYAPVGPVAEALDAIEPALTAAGLTLTRLRRSWDERFWPCATKGYFGLRSRIAAVLAEEGLPA